MKEDGDGYVIILRRGDRIPTEFLAAAMALTAGCMAALAIAFGRIVRYEEYSFLGEEVDPFLLAVAAAVMVFILDWAGVALYLSLVRRLKAHMFWRGALVWKLGRLLRKTAVSLYEHSSIVSRELIPFFGYGNFVIEWFRLPSGIARCYEGNSVCSNEKISGWCLGTIFTRSQRFTRRPGKSCFIWRC